MTPHTHTHTHTLSFIEKPRNSVMWIDLPISNQSHSAQVSANRHVGSLFVNKGMLFGIQEVVGCLLTPRYGASYSWVAVKV
jgi:hypothetical protein